MVVPILALLLPVAGHNATARAPASTGPSLAERIRRAKFEPCTDGACDKPPTKYERIQRVQPGYQWPDHGGYCGSWSIQRAALSKGAWISQQQVRDHTTHAPGAPAGHDNEILSSNIDEALRRLKLHAEGFDFVHAPTPQQPAFFAWLKRQLVSNATVVWMIMWDGQAYPAYQMKLPYGVHGHIEPVIGIASNHPLTEEHAGVIYDDDAFVHYTDNGVDTVYKPVASLSGEWQLGGTAHCDAGSDYCIGPYGYGWAVHGFLDARKAAAAPLSLSIEPWEREPDYRQDEPPIALSGTLTIEQLDVGSTYGIYRWDSVGAAFTYSLEHRIASFVAANQTHTFEDPTSFLNNGTTYYRCVKEDGAAAAANGAVEADGATAADGVVAAVDGGAAADGAAAKPTATGCASSCCACITGGGGEACASRCTSCSSACRTCVQYGGGAGCISDGRCACGSGPPPPPGPSGCASMNSISSSQLACTFPRLSSSLAATYAHALSAKMGSALGTSCAWAAFLGNVGTESAGLTEWTQVPCSSATGAPYCGRGPLQITGASNYEFCAGASVCGCSGIATNPTQVSNDVTVGVGTAACVWESLSGHSLSRDADGTRTGLLKTACIINAGHYPCGTPNGWASRQQYWQQANTCLGVAERNVTARVETAS